MTILRSVLFRLLLVALASSASVGAARAEPCTDSCLAPGDYDLRMTSGGYLRLYRVHVPARYTGREDVALVIDIHGHALTNDDQMKRSGQREQSDALGFVVVWPQGIANSWNGEGCCTVAYDLRIDDVGFLRDVIDTVKHRAAIDADKVYVTGWSNGAGLTQRMACEAADVVRAIAPVAHPLNTQDCRPSRAVRVLAFHGTADEVIPYEGGGSVLPREVLGIPLGWQGARQSLAAWKTLLGCSSAIDGVQLGGASRDETYHACGSNVSAGLVTVADGKHNLYTPDGNAGHVDVAAYMWTHVFRP